MIRTRSFAAAGALLLGSTIAMAAPAPAATASATAAPAAAHYTTSDTDLGTLLDNPVAKAILEKAVPGMTTNDQIDMARGMTLKSMQSYVPEQLTDAKLAEIDVELAKIKTN